MEIVRRDTGFKFSDHLIRSMFVANVSFNITLRKEKVTKIKVQRTPACDESEQKSLDK